MSCKGKGLILYDILLYMSKEIVDGVRRAIEEAQREKNLREEREAARKHREVLRREAEQQALIARNEVELRATGVVALFEELRDSKTLTMSEMSVPAKIDWSPGKTIISISFDEYDYFQPDSDGGGETITTSRTLDAAVLASGDLMIGRHVMKRGEKLGDVVRDEILRLKGLKEKEVPEDSWDHLGDHLGAFFGRLYRDIRDSLR